MTEPRTPSTAGHVPAAWRDELVVALRMRDVTGARIGEILAEVEEFCADSGQDAPTAFGAARAYAESLVTGDEGARRGLGGDVRAVGQVLVGFVGLVVVLTCVVDDGPDLVVTVGWLLALPLVLAASVLTVRLVGRGVGAGWRGLAAPVVIAVLTPVAAVALGLLLTTPVATIPDSVAIAVGAVLLVGDAVVGTVRARRRPSADLVTAPGADPAETRRRNVRADTLTAWVTTGLALVGVVVLLSLDALLR